MTEEAEETGIFTDHFDARREASLDDRRLIKVRDLYRLGPYRSASWRRDVVIYSQRLEHKLRDKSAPIGTLRDALRQVVLFPTLLGLIGVRLQLRLPDVRQHLTSSTQKVALLRVNYYLATAGDVQAIELVIQECLNLAIAARTPEIQTDYIRAALGWAVHLKLYDWPKYSRRSQNAVFAVGDKILTNIHKVMTKKMREARG